MGRKAYLIIFDHQKDANAVYRAIKEEHPEWHYFGFEIRPNSSTDVPFIFTNQLVAYDSPSFNGFNILAKTRAYNVCDKDRVINWIQYMSSNVNEVSSWETTDTDPDLKILKEKSKVSPKEDTILFHSPCDDCENDCICKYKTYMDDFMDQMNYIFNHSDSLQRYQDMVNVCFGNESMFYIECKQYSSHTQYRRPVYY